MSICKIKIVWLIRILWSVEGRYPAVVSTSTHNSHRMLNAYLPITSNRERDIYKSKYLLNCSLKSMKYIIICWCRSPKILMNNIRNMNWISLPKCCVINTKDCTKIILCYENKNFSEKIIALPVKLITLYVICFIIIYCTQ